MDAITEMLKASPQKPFGNQDLLAECIRACGTCAQACVACADACLSEDHVANLKKCIRFNLDCADACTATERILSRQHAAEVAVIRAQVLALREICRACGDECAMHKDMHAHCAVCMQACRACEDACDALLSSFGEAQANRH